ncbi:MAG: hypothetical protein O0W93_09425, partial [Methanocorpusculum sp.]|nr:hypothetical protein [Methanocorpusculum sp.]
TQYVTDLTFEIAVIVIAAAILGYTIVAVYSLGVCYKEISSTAPELRYGVTTMVTDTWHEFSYPALVLVLIVIASACAALAGAIYGLVNTIEKHKEEIKDIEEMKKMVKEHGFTVPDGTDASVWV